MTQDRVAQLEQVARHLYEGDWEDQPIEPWDTFSQKEIYARFSEFALSLAEATREGIAKWHDGEMSGCIALAESAERNGDHDDARIHSLSAAEHRHSAATIRATPIPIGNAATQETDHDD